VGRRLLGLAATFGVAVFLLGCSNAKVIDSDRLQQIVESGLQDNGITANVTCPNNEPIQQGHSFDCQAVTQDELTVTILITQSDNSGTVQWQIVGN